MADLKAFRKANKLTQEQVADYLGIKKPFICKIETGREGFPDKHLRKLLDNPHGWDVAHLVGVSETITETTDTSEQPTEDVVVISTQMLEEMTAQRQLTEQALAMVQEQLEAKKETIEAVREQLATTQEQLTTSQEQLTAEQKQTSVAQQHLTVEQQQTNRAIEEARLTREAMDRRLAESNQHITELIMMLKKSEARIERELAIQQQQHRDQLSKEREGAHAHTQPGKKSQDA
jgi:transcriptional regulator with XRE-family HTH domain